LPERDDSAQPPSERKHASYEADRQEKLMCVFGRRADQRDTEKLEPGCV